MGTTSEGVFILTPPSYPRGIILGDTSKPSQTEFEQSLTQQYRLGRQLVYDDGRKFRYAYNGGTALAKAYMTQSPAGVTNCQAETQTTSGANVNIGDQEIIVDVTNASAITDDLYAEGWLHVDSSTGIGDGYKIISCQLLTTITARLLLETPIRTDWSATSVITLTKNRWNGVLVSVTTATQTPTGVPLIAVSVNYYCWLQTAGPCPIYVDNGDTIVIGNNVGTPGTAAAAGTCGTQTAGTLPIWGQVMYVAAGDAVALIDLHLD